MRINPSAMVWSKILKIEDSSLLVVFLALILIVWVLLAIPLTIYFLIDDDVSGKLGDTFGIVNSIFSSLAFGALLYTIQLQKKELKETRDEFKIQNATLRSQRFETTYFNLLTLHRQTIESLVYNGARTQYRGHQVFLLIANGIKRYLGNVVLDPNSEDFASKLQRMEIDYRKEVNANYLGNIELYLGSLITILQFIRESDLIDNKSKILYYSILEGSLGRNEKRVLFYHFTLYKLNETNLTLAELESYRPFILKISVPRFHHSHELLAHRRKDEIVESQKYS